jgi:hypothetical protein
VYPEDTRWTCSSEPPPTTPRLLGVLRTSRWGTRNTKCRVKHGLALKSFSYNGREEILKLEAAFWVELTATVQGQIEQVQKGSYKSRKEAIEAVDQEMRKVFDALRKEHSRR